ncbi:hypothetical protein [Sphingobium sp. B11D3B]|uniref:hypothetical protein n=1 Tax=Sphingobium sp. B11D3B TaxID=2940575 RepID=UPI002227FA47|nr:hypothetical protein [Sphingobium sp. B11D3B]
MERGRDFAQSIEQRRRRDFRELSATRKLVSWRTATLQGAHSFPAVQHQKMAEFCGAATILPCP